MTLSDNLHLGDRVQLAPSWEHGEHNSRPAVQLATVIYIHPEGRYCTVRYKDDLTDTVQTVPAERLAHKPNVAEAYKHKANLYVRDAMKGLHLRMEDVSIAMGHSRCWLSKHLAYEISAPEKQEIINVAKKLAAERSTA
ncbi:MAG: hypothetical protein LUC48_09735 [Clostridiales bacterium]|nr:hypothetical protein [Clostridiales bacterium]